MNPQAQQPAKILVVDDNKSVRVMLREMLKVLGYTVVEEGHSTAVLRTIAKEKPDLVTLDIEMPGANGFQILKAMKQKKMKVPVLIISAYLDATYTRRLLDLGVKHMMSKPVSLEALGEKVAKTLGVKSAAT